MGARLPRPSRNRMLLHRVSCSLGQEPASHWNKYLQRALSELNPGRGYGLYPHGAENALKVRTRICVRLDGGRRFLERTLRHFRHRGVKENYKDPVVSDLAEPYIRDDPGCVVSRPMGELMNRRLLRLMAVYSVVQKCSNYFGVKCSNYFGVNRCGSNQV
jgi:hypothetical protein